MTSEISLQILLQSTQRKTFITYFISFFFLFSLLHIYAINNVLIIQHDSKSHYRNWMCSSKDISLSQRDYLRHLVLCVSPDPSVVYISPTRYTFYIIYTYNIICETHQRTFLSFLKCAHMYTQVSKYSILFLFSPCVVGFLVSWMCGI